MTRPFPRFIALTIGAIVSCGPGDKNVLAQSIGPVQTAYTLTPTPAFPGSYAAPAYQPPVYPAQPAPYQAQPAPYQPPAVPPYVAPAPATTTRYIPTQPTYVPVQPADIYQPAPLVNALPAPIISERPPARTALERLNPGMPRLVESSRPRTNAPLSISSATTPGYAASLSTPPRIEYNIPHIPQEEPLWCWAAAAQQAIGWVNNGRAPTQCAIVALAHGMSVEECCGDKKGICARTGEIPAIAKLIRRFGGQAAETATVPRTPKEVYSILQTGATLLIRLRPAPNDAAVGIRHMIVVRGIEWLRLPNGQLEATLFYNDPLGSGYRAVTFEEIEGFFEQALVVRRTS